MRGSKDPIDDIFKVLDESDDEKQTKNIRKKSPKPK
jgi:hypothetical protein